MGYAGGQGGTSIVTALGWTRRASQAGSWAHPDLPAPLWCRAGGMLLPTPRWTPTLTPPVLPSPLTTDFGDCFSHLNIGGRERVKSK